MAHFKKPPQAPGANYDKKPTPPHAVIRMRVRHLTWAPVIIWGEERLKIDSGNKTVLPLEGIESGRYNSATADRPLQFFGRQAGKSNVVAKLNVNGTMKDWTEAVEVSVAAHRLFRVHLQTRHMALNAHDMSRSARYEMDVTKLVPKDMKPEDLFKFIKAEASNKKLKHLVFNSHGFVGQIEIFGHHNKVVLDSSNVHLFAEIKGLVDTIWITSCAVGHEFCKQVADQAKCHVVGALKTVPITEIKLAKGQFDFNIGCEPTAVLDGNPIAFANFVMKDRNSSFELQPASSKDPLSN